MLTRLRRWLNGAPNVGGSAHSAMSWNVPFSPVATQTDILHCFRLLLGRNPNPEEWEGHAGRAGEPLEGLVAGYLRSLEFAKRGLLDAPALRDIAVARLGDFDIYVAPDDLDVGRHVLSNTYEPDVSAVFRRLLRPDMAVLDIGANIGFFTMLSASLVGPAGFVLAVEPNPANARLIEASRRLNGYGQVTIAQVAAGRSTGLLALHTAQSNGTTSNPSNDLALLLSAQTVPAIAIDQLLAPDRRVDLIKVDVEGAEYNALMGCAQLIARDRPSIISEFSPDMMPGISGVSGEEYLSWILERGYRIAVIQGDGSTSPPFDQPGGVMAAYHARSRDHIDVLATPAG